MADVKARYWTIVSYAESVSVPYGYDSIEDYLACLGVPYACALHDHDVDIDGEFKKAHYHYLFAFDGPTTYRNVVEKIAVPLGSKIAKVVLSPRGMFRYLTHKDNPEKYQYDDSIIQCKNGFSPEEMHCISCTDETQLYDQILDLVEDNSFTEFYQLVYFVRYNCPQFKSYIYKHSHFFNAVLTSKREIIRASDVTIKDRGVV